MAPAEHRRDRPLAWVALVASVAVPLVLVYVLDNDSDAVRRLAALQQENGYLGGQVATLREQRTVLRERIARLRIVREDGSTSTRELTRKVTRGPAPAPAPGAPSEAGPGPRPHRTPPPHRPHPRSPDQPEEPPEQPWMLRLPLPSLSPILDCPPLNLPLPC